MRVVGGYTALGISLDYPLLLPIKSSLTVYYVSPENQAKLKEFMAQQRLTESKAIDIILGQFFGTAPTGTLESTFSNTPGVLERLATLERQMAEVLGESAA